MVGERKTFTYFTCTCILYNYLVVCVLPILRLIKFYHSMNIVMRFASEY